jgi:hypothetical protein
MVALIGIPRIRRRLLFVSVSWVCCLADDALSQATDPISMYVMSDYQKKSPVVIHHISQSSIDDAQISLTNNSFTPVTGVHLGVRYAAFASCRPQTTANIRPEQTQEELTFADHVSIHPGESVTLSLRSPGVRGIVKVVEALQVLNVQASISVESVAFSDGSTWKATQDEPHVTPFLRDVICSSPGQTKEVIGKLAGIKRIAKSDDSESEEQKIGSFLITCKIAGEVASCFTSDVRP